MPVWGVSFSGVTVSLRMGSTFKHVSRSFETVSHRKSAFARKNSSSPDISN
ncbi:MAG: hypothetical protein Q4A71_01405 [Actinomycetaceae bacterium]|nr:hypothetical protein [Actinomycetaceae bacterium]